MTSMKLDLSASGPLFDFTTPLRDFDCTVQNALVNIGTEIGSDPTYPDRGTNLAKDAAQGRMVNESWANHTANFAALKTLSFLQQTDTDNSVSALTSLQLQVSQLQDQAVSLLLQAKGSRGELRGQLATL